VTDLYHLQMWDDGYKRIVNIDVSTLFTVSKWPSFEWPWCMGSIHPSSFNKCVEDMRPFDLTWNVGFNTSSLGFSVTNLLEDTPKGTKWMSVVSVSKMNHLK